MNIDFYGNTNPEGLISKYGSPLYVYNEDILRERCREIKNLLPYGWFGANYSTKANSNLHLLRIIREEGFEADAMSPGEMNLLLAAGFKPSQLLYVSNNVSSEEMEFAIERGILISVDSLSQLECYGRINAGGKVALRFNGGIGTGHHNKVITAGKKTKFGISPSSIREVKEIARRYSLNVAGINQHIGSLFLDGQPYMEGAGALLDIASGFPDLEFLDLGGGFGVPYRKEENRLDLNKISRELANMLLDWMEHYGKEVRIKVEPGRYISAECGVLLGTVHALKENSGIDFIGTDLGLNVLMRPVLYDSYHDIAAYRQGRTISSCNERLYTVVGNICESGDILARDRSFPEIMEGDILAVQNAGAYGYVMSSNYNQRLRPAEVLIGSDGSHRLIRRRDTLDDLLRNYIF